MIVTILMFLILFACVAMLYNDGMWSNAIRLINVITAALLAMNFFEPLADWLEQTVAPSYTFFWDFIALWGLFIVFSIIFRLLTDRLSTGESEVSEDGRSNRQRRFVVVDRLGDGVLHNDVVCTLPRWRKTAFLRVFNPKRRWFWVLPPIGNGWDSRKKCLRGLTSGRPAKKQCSIRTVNSSLNTPHDGQHWKAMFKAKARLHLAPNSDRRFSMPSKSL